MWEQSAKDAPVPPPEPERRRSSTSLARVQRRFKTFRSLSSSTLSNKELAKFSEGPLGLTILCDRTEPKVDVIFVHGLGGDSRKTWSVSSNPSTFWPKEWLSTELEFKHARVHTYGYNSAWTQKQENVLDIHDFGQALLVDMFNSPHLRRNKNTSIILVGHSMGGLLMKKAYLLATRDPSYQDFAKRIRSMYFLSTPHRGADLAKLLSKCIAATMLVGTKPYVNDLHPQSQIIRSINDEFRHVSQSLDIWSFYETQPTHLPTVSAIVVEKDSAIMGLPGEQTHFLEGDHRGVCKFDSPEHPNYVVVKDCLSTTVSQLENEYSLTRGSELKSEMKMISTFLGIDQAPIADLLSLNQQQLPGTCNWLTDDSNFEAWLGKFLDGDESSTEDETPRFLLLSGPPGSGKSVICGHVVQYLRSCDLDHEFYFFKQTHREKSTVDVVLRSLAFQMAESSFDFRHDVLEMIKNEEMVTLKDYNMIWSSIFMSRMFKLKFTSPQFWVIDALDECDNKSIGILLQLFSKIPNEVPLQIFLSSRPTGQVQLALGREGIPWLELQTGGQNSLNDIAKFVRSRATYNPEDDASEGLMSDILVKSNGIFLWASLTMSRLDETYSKEDVQEVLQQVPTEMNEVYNRIARTIAATPSFDLAKCILKWTVCSPRPLTMLEVKDAVMYDINRTLTASKDRIGHLCGNLISVDSLSRIQVIHQTVTAFLTQQKSEFWIDKPAAHARIAEVCLSHLSSEKLAPPRRLPSTSGYTTAFTEYADSYFSYHLAHATSGADRPLINLGHFLESNILTWIERSASKGDFKILLKAVENLRSYLARRGKYLSPLSKEVRLAKSWIKDLTHIVALFGPNLLDLPSSIYSLVPAMSPPASQIHHFIKDSRQVKILGLPTEMDWDDRISCFMYESSATSIATCEQYFAVGLSNGYVKVYSSATLELVETLFHKEPVQLLSFAPVSGNLVACGLRLMSFWNSRRSLVWTKNVKHPRTPLRVCFSPEEDQIFVASKDSNISTLSSQNGSQIDQFSFDRDMDSDSDEEDRMILPGTPPMHVRLSPRHGLAAITYRTSPVLIWDIHRRQKVGVFYRPGTEDVYSQPQVFDMTFNPIVELNLLAISYDEVGIAICDPLTLRQWSICDVDARTMAASLDGKTLVTGDYHGNIHVFAFEQKLKPLYHISTLDAVIRGISFTPNGMRFYDIREKYCNVWEPSVLIRRDSHDDDSTDPGSEEVPAASEVVTVTPLNDLESITCLASTAESGFLYCGRENGDISVYDVSLCRMQQTFQLYDNRYPIKHIEWNTRSHLLISVNFVNHLIVTQMVLESDGQWRSKRKALDQQFTSPISQILVNSTGDKFLISTIYEDGLWDINGLIFQQPVRLETTNRKWVLHPTNPDLLLLFESSVVHVYAWSKLKRLTLEEGIKITTETNSDIGLVGDWVCRPGASLCFNAAMSATNQNLTNFTILDVSQLDLRESSISSKSFSRRLQRNLKHVIGVYKSSVLFVDSKGWICSVRDMTSYTRHFFIPFTWMTGANLHIQVFSKSNIALAYRDRLIILRGMLKFEEKTLFR